MQVSIWGGGAIPDAKEVIDLNRSPALQGGPYILGKQFNGQAVLWGHSLGAFPSIPLLAQPSGGGLVVGRALSNSLVIPMGSILWRNSRLHSIAGLCGNPAGWSDFNITRVSPDNNLLAGSAKLGGVPHSVVFLPYQFKEVYPSSGFDGESEPNWLMIPKDGENYAKAITPASAGAAVAFRVGPDPGTGTVYPALAYSSPETITVSSSNLGDSTTVQVGLGTAFGSGGLNLSVKKYQTKTVIIHAVTQRYGPTDHMPLQPGEGRPNEICISARGGVLWSERRGDDNIVGLTITTGLDGVCDSIVDTAHDDSIIPLGRGIHKDITPEQKPTKEALQGYLHEVFGIQTNTYFEVVEGVSLTVNYDLNKNKLLDVFDKYAFTSSEEDKIIIDRGGNFHVYYVKDFKLFGTSGTSHSAIGAAHGHDSQKMAFVRDAGGILQTTAHEIGHLLKLAHSNDKKLPDGTDNPAFLPKSDAKRDLCILRLFLAIQRC